MGSVFRPTPAPAPAPTKPQPMPKPNPAIQDIDPRYDDKKRRGRRSTILTSSEGLDESLEIAKKTLLGG